MAYAFVCQVHGVRMFATKTDMDAYIDRHANCMPWTCGEIDQSPHYRGRLPKRGVEFYRNDISTPQIVAALSGDYE